MGRKKDMSTQNFIDTNKIVTLLKDTDEDNINSAIDIITSHIQIIKIDIVNLLMIVLLENQNYEKLCELFKKLQDNRKYIGESTYIIMIRMYANIKNIPMATDLIKKIDNDDIRKRTYLPIFFSYCQENNLIDAFNYFEEHLHRKYAITLDEYKALITLCLANKDNDRMMSILLSMQQNINLVDEDIIMQFKSYFLECHKVEINSKGVCSYTHNQLKSYDLSDYERSQLMKNICSKYIDHNRQSDFDKYINFLKRNSIDVFIDGGNIIFIGGKITINGYYKLDNVLGKLNELKKNGVIVIHRRHYDHIHKSGLSKDNIKLAKDLMNKWKKNNMIYFTPNYMNDDWFWLYGNLYFKNSFIITNDLLRDHIFKVSECDIINNTLSKWIDRHIVKYNFESNDPKLFFPLSYSNCIQENNTIWHFPTKDNWYCIITQK